MRNINFIAGYYEWIVEVDGKYIFAFQDGDGGLSCDLSNITNREQLIDYVNELIEYMLEILDEDNNNFVFADDELKELKSKMLDSFETHYMHKNIEQ